MNSLSKKENKQNSGDIINDKKTKFNYANYIEKTTNQISNPDTSRVLRFNKKQFLELVEIFHNTAVFISNSDASDKAIEQDEDQNTITKNIGQISSTVLLRSHHAYEPFLFDKVGALLKKMNSKFQLQIPE